MPSLDEHAQAGITAINEKKFDEAIAAFTAALALDPSRPDMNNALGMAHLHRGEAGAAIPYLEAAVTLAEPFDAPEHQDIKRHFHSGLATAYQLMDRVEDAARTLREMVDRWPADVEARLQLGSLYLGSCQVSQGLQVYEDALSLLDDDQKTAAEALVGSIKAFQQSEHTGEVFLFGHCESYREYFDKVAAEQVEKGWFAEAARMARADEDDEPKPFVPDGARPYAFMRVDLVDPSNGEVSSVYSEQEPMIIALNGLEPLAQVPIQFSWPGQAFEVMVSTQCPWHWLAVTIQLRSPCDEEARLAAIDETIGAWYLAGYNGDFGDQDTGRFHYVTDPECLGDRGITYTIDLGRASFEAVRSLLKRLTILHDRVPIERVVFGQCRLPD